MESPAHPAIIQDCTITAGGFATAWDGNKMTAVGDLAGSLKTQAGPSCFGSRIPLFFATLTQRSRSIHRRQHADGPAHVRAIQEVGDPAALQELADRRHLAHPDRRSGGRRASRWSALLPTSS